MRRLGDFQFLRVSVTLAQRVFLIMIHTDKCSLQVLFYMAAPTEYPPTVPIPGEHEQMEDGDNAVDGQQLSAANSGQTFSALCTLWTVASESLLVSRNVESPQANSLMFAQSKYSTLLSWAENLSISMVRSEHSPAHVVVFQ